MLFNAKIIPLKRIDYQFQLRIPPEHCHIAGHSLGKRDVIELIAAGLVIRSVSIGSGAHLAGYAGQYLRDRGLSLGRITGNRFTCGNAIDLGCIERARSALQNGSA